jgi:hypothetical protein
MTPTPNTRCLLPDEDLRSARRDALVAELRRGHAGTPSRAPRRVAGAALATAAVALIALVASSALPAGGGAALNIVAQARAAVSPEGDIVHFLVRFEPGQYGGLPAVTGGAGGQMIGHATGEIERWSAIDPSREHTTTFISPADGGAPLTTEQDYSDGTLRTHNSWETTVQVDHLTAAQSQPFEQGAGPPSAGDTGFAGDPVDTIQSLLAAGTLRPAGQEVLDGRSVLRLVGSTTTNATADGSAAPISYEYLVDPNTYAPVQITSTEQLAARPNDGDPAARAARSVVTRWVFESYERIPLTSQTAPLLSLSKAQGCPDC